jgi:hypothetical protein
MTTRVFDLQKEPVLSVPATRHKRSTRVAGLKGAALAAIMLVPVAGAAEAPAGWLAAGLTALGIVCAAAMFGSRIGWGWLAFVAGGVGLVMPRGPWGIAGPPLFVATFMCVMLWLAQRRNGRGAASRLDDGDTARAAQLMLGFSGERQVGRVLAGELPPEYALINGLKLPRGAGDIDHLVVGPTGVFLLERKNTISVRKRLGGDDGQERGNSYSAVSTP